VAQVEKAETTGEELKSSLIEAAIALTRAAQERVEVDDSEWYWYSVEGDLRYVQGHLEAGREFVSGNPEREAIFDWAVAMMSSLVAEVEAAVREDRALDVGSDVSPSRPLVLS
jgi:hypothetical protein